MQEHHTINQIFSRFAMSNKKCCVFAFLIFGIMLLMGWWGVVCTLGAGAYHKILVDAGHCTMWSRGGPRYDLIVERSLESREEVDRWRSTSEKYRKSIQGPVTEVAWSIWEVTVNTQSPWKIIQRKGRGKGWSLTMVHAELCLEGRSDNAACRSAEGWQTKEINLLTGRLYIPQTAKGCGEVAIR